MASGSPIISSEVHGLETRLRALRARNRRALIPYITAGHPSMQQSASLLDALVAAGADVIELGVPFSDPVADGPTIQRSSQRALDQGVTLAWTLDLLREFRTRHDTPVVLFTYLNPLLSHGLEQFARDAAAAGAQGLLVTDLPVDTDDAIEAALCSTGLALVRLIAPTTEPQRARRIAARASGFLYVIARTGVTGATARLRSALADEIASLRAATDVPIAVGFGISTPQQAAAVAAVADGVVVGSALIDALDRSGIDGAHDFLLSLRRAIDS